MTESTTQARQGAHRQTHSAERLGATWAQGHSGPAGHSLGRCHAACPCCTDPWSPKCCSFGGAQLFFISRSHLEFELPPPVQLHCKGTNAHTTDTEDHTHKTPTEHRVRRVHRVAQGKRPGTTSPLRARRHHTQPPSTTLYHRTTRTHPPTSGNYTLQQDASEGHPPPRAQEVATMKHPLAPPVPLHHYAASSHGTPRLSPVVVRRLIATDGRDNRTRKPNAKS